MIPAISWWWCVRAVPPTACYRLTSLPLLSVLPVSCVVARHIPDGNMSACHITDRWVTLPENCQYDIIVSCITFCSINFFRPLFYVQVMQVGVDLSLQQQYHADHVRYGAIQRVRIKTSQLAATFKTAAKHLFWWDMQDIKTCSIFVLPPQPAKDSYRTR